MNKEILIKEANGWLAVVFDEHLETQQKNLTDQDKVFVYSKKSLDGSVLSIMEDLVAGNNSICAICWYEGSNSLETIKNNLSNVIAYAGKKLALSIKNGHTNLATVDNCQSMPNQITSLLLRGMVEAFPIEEIYPNYNWQQEQKKSFVDSMHNLASLFLRLDDLESAESCIDKSQVVDEFNPRALALKAMISKAHGETLGAVANIVSSLQQYELMNKDKPKTSLSQNIEVINYKLKEGLDALNQKDNEKALSNFTEALYQFDEFYSERGLKIN